VLTLELSHFIAAPLPEGFLTPIQTGDWVLDVFNFKERDVLHFKGMIYSFCFSKALLLGSLLYSEKRFLRFLCPFIDQLMISERPDFGEIEQLSH
jgi:hypothetical protein